MIAFLLFCLTTIISLFLIRLYTVNDIKRRQNKTREDTNINESDDGSSKDD